MVNLRLPLVQLLGFFFFFGEHEILSINLYKVFFFFGVMLTYREYSRVRKWTLGLSGGEDQIAVIRASGSISRVRSPFSDSSSDIIEDKFIEKIRSVRGNILSYNSLCLI